MVRGGFKARSNPAAPLWAGAFVLFALVTLGLVHSQSARGARERVVSRPVRPLLVVDTAPNRAARGFAELADLSLWREAGARLERPVEEFTGESLAEIERRRFAVWVLPDQAQLSAADWIALDAHLEAGGGAVLTGRSGRERALERLFPGERFAAPRAGATRLRVVGRGPLVAGLEPGTELLLHAGKDALAADGGAALDWHGAGGASALHALHRGAPVAWLGFSPGALDDPAQARRIADSALRYAARQPVLDLRTWPEGRSCAVLVDVERGEEDPGAACRVQADEALEPALARLRAEGCRFATVPPGDRVLPEVKTESGSSLVAIPEPLPRRAARGAALLRELLSGYERAERMGIVYSLRADPESGAAAERAGLIASVDQELGQRGAWFAQPHELADWWLARRDTRAVLWSLAPDSVRVVFANDGSATARGVTARIYVPEGAGSPRLVGGGQLGRPPRLRLATDRSWIELVAGALDAGSEVSYTIRF